MNDSRVTIHEQLCCGSRFTLHVSRQNAFVAQFGAVMETSSVRRVACNVRRSTTKGFTLVELLVVIAIISLLASLLMPALKAARASARSVVCVSNLRQIYLSLANFAHDNDGFLPEHWSGGYVYVPTDFSAMTSWPLNMNLPKSQLAHGLQRSEHWRCPGTWIISDLYPADGSSASPYHRMWQSNPYVFTKVYAAAPYGDSAASLSVV